jgi:very-short-patch-repair endonuclease
MLNCSICGEIFLNKGGLSKHEICCEKIFNKKNEIINAYLNESLSIKELSCKYSIPRSSIIRILGDNKRTQSDATSLAHKKFPDSFSRSEESKEIIRKKRLDFMKNNPEKTAWRRYNISYPESLFLNKIYESEWDKKYSIIRELSVFPYFIDFAFINEKVAVEVDGKQHLLPERKQKDELKDKLLKQEGWSVVRVTENEVKKNIDSFFIELEKILSENVKELSYNFGIFSEKNLKIKSKKIKKSKKVKKIETKKTKTVLYKKNISLRKVERPSKEKLISEIEELGYVKTGKKYGVSDNAIRKWLKFFDKYE